MRRSGKNLEQKIDDRNQRGYNAKDGRHGFQILSLCIVFILTICSLWLGRISSQLREIIAALHG